ncbi:hypothetical protein GGS23DRAFT_94290 [Durotheca rogersii]|uniref:uncharacterized protein n=1 Tax=Durotheca rogersii TaxID=419775 RepID=UPI00221F6945|nr:uncharacterized protein GGS23DRAFT_94290 [Durotheca rogersii]KAI5862345.1 hypothetical protein GGS23DRAFT_94290 [Durotheca rogersii]
MEYTDSDQVITVLDGAVSTRVIRHPERSFAFHVTLDLEKGAEFFGRKPPIHLHANQDEYIQAVAGKLGLEIEGKELVLTSADPEYTIGRGVNHRSYPIERAGQDEGVTTVEFLLSGQRTPSVFELNTLFFENWYKYQEDMRKSNKPVSLIQILSTFDAGGTYVSVPRWVPFGRFVAQAIGIVVGRWIGGLLGYQPFYSAYSTDWPLACEKMRSTIFQRRFAKPSKTGQA